MNGGLLDLHHRRGTGGLLNELHLINLDIWYTGRPPERVLVARLNRQKGRGRCRRADRYQHQNQGG